MPPPPPPVFVAPAPLARKRPRDAVTRDPAGLPGSASSTGMHFFISEYSESRTPTCMLNEMASLAWGRSGDLCESPHW